MAITDFLFNGTPPANVSSSSASTTSMPDWYQAYIQSTLANAQAVATAPYQPYTGPKVAPFSPLQTQAQNLGQANVGATGPLTTMANKSAATAATPFNADTMSKFMNPYTKNVTDEIARLGNQNLTENVLPGVNDTFTGSGQFGSSRDLDFNARAIRDSSQAIAGQQGKALMDAQTNAMQNYLGFQNQQGTAATQLGGLAQTEQGINAGDVGALSQLGGQQQQQTQNSFNSAYQDFLTQRGWPQQMTTFLNNTVQGLTPPTGTAVQQTAPYSGSSMSPSPLAQIAGIGALYAGATAKRGGVIDSIRHRPIRLAAGGPLSLLHVRPRLMPADRLSLAGGR